MPIDIGPVAGRAGMLGASWKGGPCRDEVIRVVVEIHRACVACDPVRGASSACARVCRKIGKPADEAGNLQRPRPARNRSGHDLGPHRRSCGQSEGQVGLVRGCGHRRPLEDDQRRHDLESDLRRPGFLLARLRDPRSEQPAGGLGRQRREQHPAQRFLRRRRLQVARWRHHLDQHGPEDLRAHLDDRGRSARLERGLGGRAGTAVVLGRRTRPLRHARWRHDLEEGLRDFARHRRDRSAPRSAQSRRHVCDHLPAPPACLDRDQRWPRVGPAQVHRWRQELAHDHQRPAEGRHRPHRPGHRAGRARHDLRGHGRGRQGQRHLPLDRRRRELGKAFRLQADHGPVLQQAVCRSEGGRSLLRDGHLDACQRGRRQECPSRRRKAQARRQPRALDRSRRHRPPARRLRRRRLRELRSRRHLALVPQPAAVAVLQGRP